MKAASYLLSGLLFSLGLIVSGMTQPAKVVGFLDFLGDWDPSLAFVMGGAVLIHFPFYLWKKRRSRPLWAGSFSVPSRKDIDGRLMVGATLFGAGWGLGGYCPGPALASLGSGSAGTFVFVLSMVVGMAAFRIWDEAVGRSHPVARKGREVGARDG